MSTQNLVIEVILINPKKPFDEINAMSREEMIRVLNQENPVEEEEEM